jgi:hypothetical protein
MGRARPNCSGETLDNYDYRAMDENAVPFCRLPGDPLKQAPCFVDENVSPLAVIRSIGEVVGKLAGLDNQGSWHAGRWRREKVPAPPHRYPGFARVSCTRLFFGPFSGWARFLRFLSCVGDKRRSVKEAIIYKPF